MYQVDPKFQTHMVRHAHTEMKMQDCQDDDNEGVPIFNKKMIDGSVNTANGEKMKIKCEGKVNVNHFTMTGYESIGPLSVKVMEGLKIKLFSFTTALSNGWTMNGYKQKNGEVVIMLTLIGVQL